MFKVILQDYNLNTTTHASCCVLNTFFGPLLRVPPLCGTMCYTTEPLSIE